jgi:hypothetical protein
LSLEDTLLRTEELGFSTRPECNVQPAGEAVAIREIKYIFSLPKEI